jgi:tRNA-specific 2-thiouridylase
LGISFNTPKYVIKKNMLDNTITLGDEEDLYKKKLIACDINLIYINKNELEKNFFYVTAKTRYSSKEALAKIKLISDNKILVEFKEAQRAITPGQAVVFYQGQKVFGGGKIIEAL